MTAHRPRKRFGQHFLVDPGVVADIVAAIAPGPADTIVEIGPGPGAITGPLAARCGMLHLVELDRDLAARLRARFAGDAHVHVHEADALAFDFGRLGTGLRLAGNLPYNISTPLLFHLLDFRAAIRDMHFMLQKEVVDRMAAAPGSRTYGRLTVMLRCHLEIERLFDVDRHAFDPPPAVTSSVVRLRPRPGGSLAVADEALFGRLVAAGFAQRRKTLRNALKRDAAAGDFAAVGIDPGLRPEALAAEDWVALANQLAQRPPAGSATNADIPDRTG